MKKPFECSVILQDYHMKEIADIEILHTSRIIIDIDRVESFRPYILDNGDEDKTCVNVFFKSGLDTCLGISFDEFKTVVYNNQFHGVQSNIF